MTEVIKTVYESLADWKKEGQRRFGKEFRQWKFVCPVCGHVASVKDWEDAGDKERTMVAFSCVGRLLDKCKNAFQGNSKGKGPCDYAGGGLFRLNPICIKEGGEEHFMFDFAEGDAA